MIRTYVDRIIDKIQYMTPEEKMENLIILYKSKYNVSDCAQIFKCEEEHVTQALINYNIFGKVFCTTCNQWRFPNEFGKRSQSRDGLKYVCKACDKKWHGKHYIENKETILEACHSYYDNNTEKVHKRAKQYDLNNIEKVKKIHQDYYVENKEEINKLHKDYYDTNREKILEYQKERFQDPEVKEAARKRNNIRLKTDPMFRLRSYFGTRMYISLKGNKHGMGWEKIIGYTLGDLKLHLESKFDDKMNWVNYGSYWHVDHIVGIANFNFISYEDEAFKRCWSLQNLQPLYGPDNISKGDTISEEWNNIELAAQLLENLG
jgi:hypothetical protein